MHLHAALDQGTGDWHTVHFDGMQSLACALHSSIINTAAPDRNMYSLHCLIRDQ